MNIIKTPIERKIQRAEEIFSGVIEDIKTRTGKIDLNISFLPSLNDILLGIHKKQLTTIGGRTAQGKSSFGIQLAYDLADQHNNVLYLSLEMTKETLIEKLFSQIYYVDNQILRIGPITPEIELKAKAFMQTLEGINLLILYRIGYTFPDVYNLIERLKPCPDVVIVDYVQCISKGRASLDKLDEYIKSFRDLAVKKNFAAILLSQVHRESMLKKTTKEPQLWELKGTGALEEHSDLVLLLHWDWFYTHAKGEDRKFLIKVAKQKFGKTGVVICDYIKEYTFFKEKEVKQNETTRIYP